MFLISDVFFSDFNFLLSKKHSKLVHLDSISGFGSGDYVSKSEAADVLSNVDGRWVRFDLTGKAEEFLGTMYLMFCLCLHITFQLRIHVILETAKKMPEHLGELDIFNKVGNLFLLKSYHLSFSPADRSSHWPRSSAPWKMLEKSQLAWQNMM